MLDNLNDRLREFNARDAVTESTKPAGAFLDSPKVDAAYDEIRRSKIGEPIPGDLADNVFYAKTSPQYKRNSSGREVLANAPDLASNVQEPDGTYAIKINPKIDEVYAAHEMGHILNRQGDIGKVVRDLRNNPELTKVLAAAGAAGGLGLAIGDESNNMDEATLLALAAAAPTLVDEAGASITALDLMNKAGSRASLGQRGKLAGAYMSYLAPVILGGLGAGAVGDLLD